MTVMGVPEGALIVYVIVLIALVLFVSEVIPNDITAIGVIVALAALEPWTEVAPVDAISGFANPATITIVAMYMLSGGIQNTGLVNRLGATLARVTAGDHRKVLFATVGTAGPIAGFINNTPVVTVFIPMIDDLARRSQISASKLLLPLSYAAILGGTLTLIGSSTNIIASNLTDELLDRGPIGFFEFTHLGIIIFLVGVVYLFTIGWRLTPERVAPARNLTEEFALEDYLFQVAVRERSPLVGKRLSDIEEPAGVDILQLERGGEVFNAATTDQKLLANDRLVLLGRFSEVDQFARDNALLRLYGRTVDDTAFETPLQGDTLAKLLIPPESAYVGQTVDDSRLERRYATTVMAVSRHGEQLLEHIDETRLEAGDVLLVRSTDEALAFLAERDDVIRTDTPSYETLADHAGIKPPLSPKTLTAISAMAVVVGLAAFDIVPIVISALLGVFIMVVSGCLTPSEAYDSVSWNIIFLIAGVIPLGLALEASGGAGVIADILVQSEAVLPLIGVLLLFVIVTGLLANVITPVATIVLMIPIAVDAATQLGANEFSFLLGVMFASATSFMTPVGYQTNIMVYGPGGYRFIDFVRVGAPLQFILAVVITLGIAFFWGLTP